MIAIGAVGIVAVGAGGANGTEYSQTLEIAVRSQTKERHDCDLDFLNTTACEKRGGRECVSTLWQRQELNLDVVWNPDLA